LPRIRVGDSIRIFRAALPGEHIRPAGEDVRAGVTVLAAGTSVRPAELGLLAALGRSMVTVHRRPNVAILATGDELTAPGQPLGPGQIRNCNSPMITAMVRQAGGHPIDLGVARDSTSDLRAKLQEARGVDLLITTGGVSVGAYDLVKDVLRAAGQIEFWQVRIKPGKPLAFGHLDGTPLLGLPGNPVAAAVAFEQFAWPAIRRMLGARNLTRPTVAARLAHRVENNGGRRQFVRVHVVSDAGELIAYPLRAQGSGMLTSFVGANGLLVVAEEMAVAEAGDILPVLMLDWDA
jgi:molybdopterin molybdotransferase